MTDQKTEMPQYVEACSCADAIDYIAWDAVDGEYLRYRYCGPCFDDSNLGNCEKDGCPLFTLSTCFCREHAHLEK